MKNLIATFSQQMREAISIGEKAQLTPAKSIIANVVITGMGGSGIGGLIVSELVSAIVPITINKDYFLPAFLNENSLVIVSSNSGNTEETLSCLEQAFEKNAKVVCVTSGGKIVELAKKHTVDTILIPGGNPPRSGIGYASIQVFYILNRLNLIDASFKEQLNNTIVLLDSEEEKIKVQAIAMARQMIGKIPVIYCAASMEGVAVRFRQQINENSKMLCWHNVLPEMNHNELVGWTEKHEELVVILLRNTADFSRTQKRMDISKEVIAQYTPNIFEIYSKGNSAIENAYYHIHLGDWISYFIAEIKQVDVTEIKVIDFLKNSLAKI